MINNYKCSLFAIININQHTWTGSNTVCYGLEVMFMIGVLLSLPDWNRDRRNVISYNTVYTQYTERYGVDSRVHKESKWQKTTQTHSPRRRHSDLPTRTVGALLHFVRGKRQGAMSSGEARVQRFMGHWNDGGGGLCSILRRFRGRG